MGPASVRLTGWGRYVPERILTNHDLGRLVETNDEWITSRTGIRERRVAGPHETTASLAAVAGARALAVAGLAAGEFPGVAVAKVSELRRVMPEPGAELAGWRDVLRPLVQPGGVLAEPARPEPVHQHARPVLGFRMVVHPANPDLWLHRPILPSALT